MSVRAQSVASRIDAKQQRQGSQSVITSPEDSWKGVLGLSVASKTILNVGENMIAEDQGRRSYSQMARNNESHLSPMLCQQIGFGQTMTRNSPCSRCAWRHSFDRFKYPSCISAESSSPFVSLSPAVVSQSRLSRLTETAEIWVALSCRNTKALQERAHFYFVQV
jgi:hypothetical protein